MTVQEVLDYFGSFYRVAKDVDFSHQVPRRWEKRGFIPRDAQCRLEVYTQGKLKFNPDHLKPVNDVNEN